MGTNISTSTATAYFSVWMSRVRLIRCPAIRMIAASIKETSFHDTALFQTLGSVEADNILFRRDQFANRFKKPRH
jgi:hypothetical protein